MIKPNWKNLEQLTEGERLTALAQICKRNSEIAAEILEDYSSSSHKFSAERNLEFLEQGICYLFEDSPREKLK
jgi:hypothetical protein